MVVESPFLDANILLEIVLGRPQVSVARTLLEKSKEPGCISALTAHLVIRFGRPIVGLKIVRDFLTDYTILSLEPQDFEWAFTNALTDDFEDALQLAVAIRNGCTRFVTLDKKLYTKYRQLEVIQVELLK